VLSEFAPELVVYIADKDNHIKMTSIKKLLPAAFGPKFLPG
jgi:cytidine deaminase